MLRQNAWKLCIWGVEWGTVPVGRCLVEEIVLNRREFLRKLGKAGVAVTAGGALSASFPRRTSAAPGGAPKLIRLHGSPKTMGRQYAEQAGDLVRERLKLMKEKGTHVPMDLVEQSRIFLNVKANSVLVEIEYLASTLEVKEEDLLVLSAEPPGVGIRRGGCSSFVIDPKAATDGHVWAGENIDDTSDLERFGVVIIRHPMDSPPMITWALAGGVGAIGMNLKGIVVLMNYVQTVKKRPPVGIFPEFVANSALRQSEFKDASAVIAHTPIMGPCAFTVADAEGTRVMLERTAHIFRGMTPGALCACHTNHFLDRELQTEDETHKVFPNSKGRLKRLNRMLDRKDITLDRMKKVLADTQDEPNGICRTAEPPTIASVLLCPRKNVMLALRGRPDREKYEQFTLTRDPERE